MRAMTHSKRAVRFGACVAASLLILPAGEAVAGGGGISTGGFVAGDKAKLRSNGQAVAPASAPWRVKRAIAAANEIEDKPYAHDGGHGSWSGSGYDCSGAVNYVLGRPGARLIDSPTLVSGDYAGWGRRGKGNWITVYGNGGHVFAVIAGLRWDTSNPDRSSGPSWSRDISYGFNNVSRTAARHPRRL